MLFLLRIPKLAVRAIQLPEAPQRYTQVADLLNILFRILEKKGKNHFFKLAKTSSNQGSKDTSEISTQDSSK